MKPRFWYHCTTRDHGLTFVPARRGPLHHADREPDTPRLCVAETVAACFASVLFFPHGAAVFVYRTDRPRRANAPRRVWDASITGERWLVPPVMMVKVDTIRPGVVEEIQLPVYTYHRITRLKSDWRTRIAQYAHAANALGPKWVPNWEFRTVRRLARYAGITGDPGEWLYDQADKKVGELCGTTKAS